MKMKIGLIHLSDLHIQPNSDKLETRIDAICNAVHLKAFEIKQLYVVYGGDLTNHGSDFVNVSSFIDKLSTGLKSKFGIISIQKVIIPGNHDCQINLEDEIRTALMSSVHGNDDVPDQIIENIISVQNSFWEFYQGQIGILPKEKIFYQINFPVTLNLQISFNCYNTSWMSTRKEEPGTLIFPISKFNQLNYQKKTISVSLLHHPLPWFTPSTQGNNRKLLQKQLIESSHIVLTGHEHEAGAMKSNDLYTENSTYFIEGDSLNDGNKTSGFNLLIMESESLTAELIKFEFKGEIYIDKVNKSFQILDLKKNSIQLKPDYVTNLAKIPIPISHPLKSDLSKWDLFVYPDLEPILDKSDNAQYIESSEIILQSDAKILIEGEAQSGKTTLLQKLQLDFNEINKNVVYINAKDIKGIDAEAYIKRAVKNQFTGKQNAYEEFRALPIEDRYLVVDDIENCKLSREDKRTLFLRFEVHFSKIIVSTSSENEVHSLISSERIYQDFKHYKLLSLGKVKRNELIEKWIKLEKVFNSDEEQELTHQVQRQFDLVSELLGEQLIPPYPVFVLTILQSINANINFNIEQTSYAYCYQSLIFAGLIKSKVERDNFTSIINFLSHLAYYVYKNISLLDYEIFYRDYCDKFIMKYGSHDLLEKLIISNLVSKEDDNITFSYKYLYFYLIAKKLATEINNESIEEIRKLCSSLEIESNANIIIFLVHHTGHQGLIDELLLNSMLPFETLTPITLNQDDPFFKFLHEFISDISPEVIPRITNHNEQRKETLKRQDAIDRDRKTKKTSHNGDDEKIDEELKELIKVNKIIRILGQIVKNQQGNFHKNKLEVLLKEAYLASFRSINHVSDIIELARPKIIQHLETKIDNDFDRSHITSKIKQIIHEIGYRFCLQSFSNLCSAVGASNMNEIYSSVAKDINTPAAKLVSFAIKSYYGKLNVPELEELINEFKTNPVATDILRSRVKSYLYQHPVDYKKEQKISSICNFTLDNIKKLSYKDLKNKN